MAWLSNLPSDDIIILQTFDTSSIKVIGFQATIGISDNEKRDKVTEQTNRQPRAIKFQINANKKNVLRSSRDVARRPATIFRS